MIEKIHRIMIHMFYYS